MQRIIVGKDLRPGDTLLDKKVAVIPPFVRRPVPYNSCLYTYTTTVVFVNGSQMEIGEHTQLLVERD